MCWHEIRATSYLISDNGSKGKDIGDYPVSVLFFEHIADKLADALVDRSYLLWGKRCGVVVAGCLFGEEFCDRACNLGQVCYWSC